MPIYVYKCEKCGNVNEKEFHMTDEKPNIISCPVEGCTGVMIRQFGNVAFKIPEGWGENKIDFSKSPSRRKHFY